MKPDQAIEPVLVSISARPRSNFGEKVGLILLSGLIYAVAIASVDVASNYIPPVTLTALRLITASIIFAVLMLLFRPPLRWGPRRMADVALIGILNVGLPFLCLAIAVKYISSSLAAVLFNVQPVLTIVLAHSLLADEKLSLVKLVGTSAAVAGASILIISNESGLVIGDNQGWIGQLFVILASLTGALGVIYTRRRVRHESPFALAAGQVFACMVIFATLAPIVEGVPTFTSYPWQGWLAMISASVSAPVLGFWLLFYLINKYSASLAGFAGIATPLFSIVIGILLLGEIITMPIALGTLLLLAGVWSLNYF
jgi:drug/metabolite transporter (DMT)-like permease